MTNGKGQRLCTSWIERFVDETSSLDVPVLFRRWAAITAIASVLEQKVRLPSGGAHVYPNLYTILIGHPGTGKTRAVREAKKYLAEITDFHIAPTSLSAASLVDALVDAKRMIVRLPDEPLEYNSMLIAADELGTFVHKYDDEMIAVLSAFYDNDLYGQRRRGNDLKIKLKKPQLSLLCGSTPSNLLKFIPEGAWDQGFCSRLILVFSDERIVGDDFAGTTTGSLSSDLLHDLKLINGLVGDFGVTEDYRNLVNLWRGQDEKPAPSHPKLVHYNTRRRVHFYKLSMVAAIERSNVLTLTGDDFNRAMSWLVEAETFMPDIFKAGGTGADSQAMDEIYFFVSTGDLTGKGISEQRLINYARERVPAHAVMRVLEVMTGAGMIQKSTGMDLKTGQFYWRAIPRQ